MKVTPYTCVDDEPKVVSVANQLATNKLRVNAYDMTTFE